MAKKSKIAGHSEQSAVLKAMQQQDILTAPSRQHWAVVQLPHTSASFSERGQMARRGELPGVSKAS